MAEAAEPGKMLLEAFSMSEPGFQRPNSSKRYAVDQARDDDLAEPVFLDSECGSWNVHWH
jgi:hypothetical protein